MSELDISESYIDEYLEDTSNTRKCGEEFFRLFDRHIEDFGDIFSFELYIERFRIVPSTSARLTFDIDIREKVHFYLLDSTSLTDFTSTSFRIE